MTDDITKADLNDLLAGVEDRVPRPESPVAMWAKSEGYYPGTTRIGAKDLYARFSDWWRNHKENSTPHHPYPLNRWGDDMARLFKKGRSNSGNFYYISRETVVDLPHEIIEGGQGTGQG